MSSDAEQPVAAAAFSETARRTRVVLGETARLTRIPLALALVVAGTRFMEILDGTILASAAPAMSRTLDVPVVAINVAITTYLITIAVFMPISGHLADRYGGRRVFLAAIVGFTLASGLCALAQDLPELVIARVIQGAAGAMMVPVGRLSVLQNTPKQSMLTAVAYLTWPALLAPVIAPVAGGLVVSFASWRWIFVINVPLGALAFIVATRVVPVSRRLPSTRMMIDWTGFILVGATLAAATIAGEAAGVGAVSYLVPSATIFFVSALLARRHLRAAKRPLLDLSVLRIDTFRIANVTGTMYRATVEAAPFVLQLMLQEGWGWKPYRAGLAVMALFAGNLLIKPVTTPLLRFFSFRNVVVGSTVIGSVAFVACAVLGPSMPIGVDAGVLFVSGAARSVGFTAYFTLSFAEVPAPRMSAANTMTATIQQVGSTSGVLVGALALQAAATVIPGGGSLSNPAPYRATFIILAVLMLVTIPGACRLRADAGAVVRRVGAPA